MSDVENPVESPTEPSEEFNVSTGTELPEDPNVDVEESTDDPEDNDVEYLDSEEDPEEIDFDEAGIVVEPFSIIEAITRSELKNELNVAITRLNQSIVIASDSGERRAAIELRGLVGGTIESIEQVFQAAGYTVRILDSKLVVMW